MSRGHAKVRRCYDVAPAKWSPIQYCPGLVRYYGAWLWFCSMQWWYSVVKVWHSTAMVSSRIAQHLVLLYQVTVGFGGSLTCTGTVSQYFVWLWLSLAERSLVK